MIGGGLGVIAGYRGGSVNTLIMRTMDVFYAFPSSAAGDRRLRSDRRGLLNTVMALSIVFIPPMVRIAESVTARERNLDYVEAARASGATATADHPPSHAGATSSAPILVYAASLASLSIILAAGLSFLGLGMPPPQRRMGPDAELAAPGDLRAAHGSRPCPA